MNTIQEAINIRIDEVGQANFEALTASGLQQKYIDVYEQIIKLIPETAVALMVELDGIMVDIEAFVEELSYRAGLSDGMTIGGATK